MIGWHRHPENGSSIGLCRGNWYPAMGKGGGWVRSFADLLWVSALVLGLLGIPEFLPEPERILIKLLSILQRF